MITHQKTITTPQAHHNELRLNLFLGFIICVGALFLFGILARGILNSSPIVQIDQNVATTLHGLASPDETNLFKIITLLGFQGLWVVVGAVAIYLLDKRKFARLTVWLAGYIGAEVLNSVLKVFFNRPRPVFTDPLLTAANASFPSGHAMSSLVVYGLLAFFIMLHLRSNFARTAVLIVTVALILLIGFTRIYLGVHYFSDVVGGYIVGTAWLSICISALNIFENRHQNRITVSSESKSA